MTALLASSHWVSMQAKGSGLLLDGNGLSGESTRCGFSNDLKIAALRANLGQTLVL
jgi:hypothetical protein